MPDKEDIIDEYLNVLNGRVGIDEFMEKYDFDYLVVASSEATIYDYLMNKDKELSVGGIKYKMIYADEASEIMVYEKA